MASGSTSDRFYRVIIGIGSLLAGAFHEIVHLRRRGVGAEIDGPALVVSNHPNSLLDPILVARSTSTRLHFIAKAPLFRMPVLGTLVRLAGALPVTRRSDGPDTSANESTFAAVHRALADGAVVAIFPEGTSHDDTTLLRLRTGAARMVLGGLAEGAASVAVVPVGLWYGEKTRFRSSAATLRGAPLVIDDPSIGVDELTDRIEAALRSVTVNAETRAEANLARDLVDLDLDTSPLRAAAIARMTQRLDRADAETVTELRRLVTRAEWLGATPNELGRLDQVDGEDLWVDVAKTAATFPGAIVGAAAGAPAFLATNHLAPRITKKPSEAATMKVAAGLVAYPVWGFVAHRLLRRRVEHAWPAAGLVAAGWILHLAARPTFAALRARWSRQRLAGRLNSIPGLRSELGSIRDEIRERLAGLDDGLGGGDRDDEVAAEGDPHRASLANGPDADVR